MAADTLRVACMGAGYFSQFHHEACCDTQLAPAREVCESAYPDLDALLAEVSPHIPDQAD